MVNSEGKNVGQAMNDPVGVCLWFTGPSGAGKSTVTSQLVPMLEDRGRTVTVLDVVPELAKHWAERTSEGKLIRKAFVASEIVRHRGIAICVTVSAREDVRRRARQLVGPDNFLEIFLDAPSDVTRRRRAARSKRPPLVKRFRRLIRRLRRLARPGRQRRDYERPSSPDLTLNSIDASPEEIAETILRLLIRRGYVHADGQEAGGVDPGTTLRSKAGSGGSEG